MLTTAELLKQLPDVSRSRLRKWIDQGLPHTRNGRRLEYDEAQVIAWLVDNGHANAPPIDESPPEQILRTRAELGRHFGVTTRTISEWQDKPGFPGRPGTAGKRDGFYPVNQIRKWLEENDLRTTGGDGTSELGQALQREKLRSLKLKNDAVEGTLVDLESVRRLVVHANSLAARELYKLPPTIIQQLPAGLDEVIIQEVRRRALQTIDNACEILAGLMRDSLLDGQTTESDNGPDQ